MDASGSMGEKERQLAKRFFILLYLFLEQQYEEVEIVFIAHHSEAQELTETQFFSVQGTGGTIVASAFQLMDKIINDRYDSTKVNIYAAQASDGDLFENEKEFLDAFNKVLPKLQYIAYMQTVESDRQSVSQSVLRAYGFMKDREDLYNFYDRNFKDDNRVGITLAGCLEDVFGCLKKLFKRNKE
jgi:uncharacterized sporulation protein YeaH/YhbH (DUF444 family)